MTATTTTTPAGAFEEARANHSTTIDVDRLSLLGLNQERLPATDDLMAGSLSRLRAMLPRRPLGMREAESIAERQAGRLRSELGVLGPQLKESDLATLPWLTITRREVFPTSGLAMKTDYGWVIVVRSSEAKVRQRFSLAHEIKHCLDDPFIDGLYPAIGGYGSDERTERICDRFAAALLMPRVLLRADWADRLQDIALLARRYDVSRAAMQIRLTQLGLLEPTPRCAVTTTNHAKEMSA